MNQLVLHSLRSLTFVSVIATLWPTTLEPHSLYMPRAVAQAYTDGTSAVVHETSGIWVKNMTRATVSIPSAKPVRSIQLQGGLWVDADSTNNLWNAPGRP